MAASTDSGGEKGGCGIGGGGGGGAQTTNEQFWVPPTTVQKKRAQSLTPGIGIGIIRNDSDDGRWTLSYACYV